MPVKHAISIDLEFWYLGFLSRNIKGWEKFGSNDESIVHSILSLLERYKVKATFFVLGQYAVQHPDIVRQIVSSGHEIATHGYLHKAISFFSPGEFREDVHRSVGILEDIIQKKVIGHRATGWSLQKEYLWALDILSEEGMLYDSSIAPTIFHKYGIKNFKKVPHKIDLKGNKSIYEFPLQVFSISKLRLPSAGGFYLRALPFSITKHSILQSEKKHVSGMVYFHPYDLDINTPRIKTGFAFKLIRYYNLEKTEIYLNMLLQQFEFCSIEEIYKYLSTSQ